MKRTITVILAMALMFTGCVTFDPLNEGMDTMMGKPLFELINIIGEPDGMIDLGDGEYTYVWSNQKSGAYTKTRNTPVYGTTIDPYTGLATYGVTGYKTEVTTIPYDHKCDIRATTNVNRIIISMKYKGDVDGCYQYIEAFENHLK